MQKLSSKSRLPEIKSLLVEKFKEIGVITTSEDWNYFNCYHKPNTDDKEYKMFHTTFDYVDVQEYKGKLSYNLDILALFRKSIQADDIELVKTLFTALLKKHNNPNISYYEDTQHNLTNAARHGNLEIIEYLVENGVSISVPYEDNILAALKNNKYTVVQYFLEKEPNINQEIMFNDKSLDENMINFVKNWNLYKKLEEKVPNKNHNERKSKL